MINCCPELGTVVKARRTTLKYSQRRVAQRSGLDPSYICKIEAGKLSYPPSRETISALAIALQMEEYLLLLHARHLPHCIEPLVCDFLIHTGDRAIDIMQNAMKGECHEQR